MKFRLLKRKTKYSVLLIIFIVLFSIGSYYIFDATHPLYYGKKSDHFDGKFFHNYDKSLAKFDIKDVVTWYYYEFTTDIKKLWPSKTIDDFPQIVVDPVVNKDFKITFINHMTFIMQAYGLNILTDPLFSERVSPLKKIGGPLRFRRPAVELFLLPKIDYILVSHDHYDHCDVRSIKYIQQKFGTKVIAGLGMKNFFKKFGIEAIELDWWDSFKLQDDLFVNFVPAIHWSGRYGLFSNNRTLWGGFVLESKKFGNIYFSGDTAFDGGNIFKMIKNKYNEFAVSILPIGAYEPRWFMKKHHVNPQEAIYIHNILKPSVSLASHYGSFGLSLEGEGQAQQDLIKSIHEIGLDHGRFITPYHGYSHIISGS